MTGLWLARLYFCFFVSKFSFRKNQLYRILCSIPVVWILKTLSRFIYCFNWRSFGVIYHRYCFIRYAQQVNWLAVTIRMPSSYGFVQRNN